jgi:proline iminopeptidase
MSREAFPLRPLRGSRVTMIFLCVFVALPLFSFGQEKLDGRSFKSARTLIHFEVIGGGARRPIIVINGGPGFSHTYLHLSGVWEELAHDGPVVFYDQRGTGRSQQLSQGGSSTLQDNIDDLEALRRHLNYEKVTLVGHSWGGYLSMAYAARHPDRLEKLVLVGSAGPKWFEVPDGSGEPAELFEYIFPDVVERRSRLSVRLGDARAADDDLAAYLSMLFVSEDKRDGFISACKDCQLNREVNRLVNQDLARFDMTPQLARFGFPVLIISGRYDVNVAPLVAYRIHQKVSNSELVFFEKSGHIPFYEEPAKFVEVVARFLGGR